MNWHLKIKNKLIEDLSKLANIKVSGVIVGKAIYDKKINLNEMFSIGKKC